MKLRNKGYNDHGISDTEIAEILEIIRSEDIRIAERAGRMLFKAALTVCKSTVIAKQVWMSWECGLSFDKIDTAMTIPMSKVDFYAYRRATLAEFKKLYYGCPIKKKEGGAFC